MRSRDPGLWSTRLQRNQLRGITEAAAGKRYLRALERLRELLPNLGMSGTT